MTTPLSVEHGGDLRQHSAMRRKTLTITFYLLYRYFCMQHFTVEGKIEDSSNAGAYNNKCVYVDGEGSELDGFVMEGLLIQNCGCEAMNHKVQLNVKASVSCTVNAE